MRTTAIGSKSNIDSKTQLAEDYLQVIGKTQVQWEKFKAAIEAFVFVIVKGPRRPFNVEFNKRYYTILNANLADIYNQKKSEKIKDDYVMVKEQKALDVFEKVTGKTVFAAEDIKEHQAKYTDEEFLIYELLETTLDDLEERGFSDLLKIVEDKYLDDKEYDSGNLYIVLTEAINKAEKSSELTKKVSKLKSLRDKIAPEKRKEKFISPPSSEKEKKQVSGIWTKAAAIGCCVLLGFAGYQGYKRYTARSVAIPKASLEGICPAPVNATVEAKPEKSELVQPQSIYLGRGICEIPNNATVPAEAPVVEQQPICLERGVCAAEVNETIAAQQQPYSALAFLQRDDKNWYQKASRLPIDLVGKLMLASVGLL